VSRPFIVFQDLPNVQSIVAMDVVLSVELKSGTVHCPQSYWQVIGANPANLMNITAPDFGRVSSDKKYSEKRLGTWPKDKL
jgi:hypothetical protein